MALRTNFFLEQKLPPEEKTTQGDLPEFAYGESRFWLEQEKITSESDGAYSLTVGLRVLLVKKKKKKELKKERRVIYVQVAAVQSLPSPELLKHSHCFGTLWNFLPYFLAYAHNFLASPVALSSLYALILILCLLELQIQLLFFCGFK